MSFFIALGKKAGFHKDPLRWNRVSSWWVISMFLPQENNLKILFFFFFFKGKMGDLLGITFRLCAYWSCIFCNWASWSAKLRFGWATLQILPFAASDIGLFFARAERYLACLKTTTWCHLKVRSETAQCWDSSPQQMSDARIKQGSQPQLPSHTAYGLTGPNVTSEGK